MKSHFEKNLMVSVSGIRGKVEETLTIEVITKFIQAFGTYIQGKNIVIARDNRPSGYFIESLLKGILLGFNKNIIQLGILPTPTLKSVVKKYGDAGIMISASHNPVEWNAFKFVDSDGFFFKQNDLETLLNIIENQKYKKLHFNPNSTCKNQKELQQVHIDSILSRMDTKIVKKRKIRVFLDALNGTGSEIIPELLKKLNCEIYTHRCDTNGLFPEKSEPNPENLKETTQIFLKSKADIGFAVDPDADRLIVFTPKRGILSEEYTFILALCYFLETGLSKGNFILNLSSSFISEKITEKSGLKCYRSAVGEANVVEEMIQKNSFLGGEGNGGVIDPLVSSFGRDSLTGIVHILSLISKTEKTIDTVLDELPEIFMQKKTYKTSPLNVENLFHELTCSFPKHTLNTKDGFKLSSDSNWLHLRKSNTEPLLRVILEASSQKDLELLSKQVQNTISNSFS